MRTTYRPEYKPSAREVRDVFADEMRSLGGAVVDELEDADNFIGRAVLQSDAEIRPGDVVKGGVAIRVTGTEILVHPYTFRLVCTNGAIVAHALGSRRIERIECTEVFQPAYESARALVDVADAVRECADRESFMNIAGQMRTAADSDADQVLEAVRMFAGWPPAIRAQYMPGILDRFFADPDRSAFGVLNAVTSVARDTRDPDARWRLEALGGECLAAMSGSRPEKAPGHAGVGHDTIR